MAYYAFLDENNTVVEVIFGMDETQKIDKLDTETWYGNFRGLKCVRTSYNTHGGVHANGGTPFNKNYAGIGYSWDGTGFAAPQPYPSWTLDKETYLWTAPVAMPTDGKPYTWNEDSKSWDEVALASNA